MKFSDHTLSDEQLIADAVAGNKEALEVLIKRYQDYIYNISLRLFIDPDDALDATQEVLIKVVTGLRTFGGRSKFSTWLYRIAVNHFLSAPVNKIEKQFVKGFDVNTIDYREEERNSYTEDELEEVRILCSTAMLLCLNRDQRLIYIIGEVFNADHTIGAELFNTTPGNFRVLLHRAKTDLMNYVSGRCGLINPKNPCRCNKKAKAMIEKGYVNASNLQFNKAHLQKINTLVTQRKDDVSDDIHFRVTELFRNSPLVIKDELNKIFDNIIK
ncbi:RNA polymerase sigma factor [Lacibacter sp. MH-610]|uniref:RNA polymerase sigma factor n=1 Tax=Lacibacter sp. MH-610 TaxID=3020883 RepID=UPI0038927E64